MLINSCRVAVIGHPVCLSACWSAPGRTAINLYSADSGSPNWGGQFDVIWLRYPLIICNYAIPLHMPCVRRASFQLSPTSINTYFMRLIHRTSLSVPRPNWQDRAVGRRSQGITQLAGTFTRFITRCCWSGQLSIGQATSPRNDNEFNVEAQMDSAVSIVRVDDDTDAISLYSGIDSIALTVQWRWRRRLWQLSPW